MSAKVKNFALLCLASLLAGGAAVFAFFVLLLPRQRQAAAEEVVRAAAQKAEALRAAAKLTEKHTEQQVATVEVRVEKEKVEDPVDFANDFIKEKKS